MRSAVTVASILALVAQSPTFDVQSRLVLVPVVVTDAKGHAIEDLGNADFRVSDNGRRLQATVDTFATGVAPIALVVAVQSSGISAPVLAKVRKIGSMIQPLITGERGCAALLSFSERVEWLQPCTTDVDALSCAFQELRPGDDTSGRMVDAVDEAIAHLRTRVNVRRVLLLISESRDRGSNKDVDSVVVAAQSAGVTVYAATYSAMKTAFTAKPSDTGPAHVREGVPVPSREPESPPGRERVPIPPPQQRVDLPAAIVELSRLHIPKTTEVLSAATGGTAFPFTRQKGLENAIRKLGDELHSQYVVSFIPDDPSPGYHRIDVQVVRSGDFRIRARPGYWWTSTARTSR